jgi:hypothetical protein
MKMGRKITVIVCRHLQIRRARALIGDALDNPEPWCFTTSPCGWPICGLTVENTCLSFAAIRIAHHNAELDVSRFPDSVTFGYLQPRMLCTVCDHRGADVARPGCIIAD